GGLMVAEGRPGGICGPSNTPTAADGGFYVPFYVNPAGPPPAGPFISQFATVVVKPRPGQRADALAAVLRREVQKADPNLPLYFIGTPRSQTEVFLAQNRIIATMFTIFGAVAVVLASVGIYGVMSVAVNQRTQEFGVRMALGASGRRILRMVLQQGVLQLAVGLALGLGLAFGLAAIAADGIRATLFGVTGRDPLIYAAVASLVAV